MMIDWTDLYDQYRGQWVALKSDEKTVVGSVKTARQALDKAGICLVNARKQVRAGADWLQII